MTIADRVRKHGNTERGFVEKNAAGWTYGSAPT